MQLRVSPHEQRKLQRWELVILNTLLDKWTFEMQGKLSYLKMETIF